MCFVRRCCLLLLLLSFTACGGTADDLFPSGTDERPSVPPGTTGPAVGQNAPNFAVSDTNGNIVTLASASANRKGVVLYFTMWCPICDSHMSDMLRNVIPSHPDVGFFSVDYVSGSVGDARSAQVENGYADTPFTVLADIGQILLQSYQATMGTTVVIDNTGVIRMNEDYRNGSQLQAVLAGLP